MKLVIQRVKEASCVINNKLYSKINNGLLIYIGITHEDKIEDIDKYINKILNLRIFEDDNKKMNLNIKDVNGSILLVSQFTLYANIKKGNRPSFINAAKPNYALKLYNEFVNKLSKHINTKTGVFGEFMEIESINDGPVTIIMEDL